MRLLVRVGVRVSLCAGGRSSRRPGGNNDYLCSLGAALTTYGEGVADHGFVDATIELCGDIDRIVTISWFDAAEKGGTDSQGNASKSTVTDFAPVVGLAASGDFAAEIAQTFAFDDLPAAHELSDNGHLRGKMVVTGSDAG